MGVGSDSCACVREAAGVRHGRLALYHARGVLRIGRFARPFLDDIGAGSSAFESEHNSAASPHTRPSSPHAKSSARHLRRCRIGVSLSCVVFGPAQRCVFNASELYIPRSKAAAKYAPAGPEASSISCVAAHHAHISSWAVLHSATKTLADMHSRRIAYFIAALASRGRDKTASPPGDKEPETNSEKFNVVGLRRNLLLKSQIWPKLRPLVRRKRVYGEH